jgi:hypothetical protein
MEVQSMKLRLWLASATLGLSSLFAAVAVPATTLAATTPAASATVAAATTACTDGHWPRTVQGRPTLFHAGARAGDYIWHDANGWHVRVTHATSTRFVFSGRIVSSAPLDATPVKLEGRDYVALSADRKTITYRLVNYGGIDGFNFRTACARRLSFLGYMNGARLPVARIWLGYHNVHPLQNPFIVTRVS